MKLPFTVDQFLEVFRNYNKAIFPLQLLFVLMAAAVVILAWRNRIVYGRVILIILAAFWIWMGIAYHIMFFSGINKAAYLFGALFIVQGIIFLVNIKHAQHFSFQKNFHGVAGAALLIYALIIYPLLGQLSGHGYPYSPTFGLPCPTTIFTFGILLLSNQRIPTYLIIIPLLWSVIGFTAAFTLGIYEDVGLIVAGVVFALLNFRKPRFEAIGQQGY